MRFGSKREEEQNKPIKKPTCVKSPMVFQSIFLRKSLMAKFTDVFLHSSVCIHMVLKRRKKKSDLREGNFEF
jgi:hypothetical protein